MWRRDGVLLFCAALFASAPVSADEALFRFNAPIGIDKPAAFVQLPLPASAYGRSAQTGLQDLRIVDARDERVPFAVLEPRVAQPQSVEQQRDAVLYPLPAKPAAGGVWPSPVEVTVQGERISVKRSGSAASIAPNARSGGWLVDLGERKREDSPAQSLRMQWSGPAEFSAAFSFETSDDLRSWRSGGSGQVMALAAAAGPLTQPTVMLPANAGRFLRLVWADAAAAPALTGAKVITAQHRSVAIDPPSELVFAASPEPVGKTAADDAAQRSLHFDLGGVLPLVQIDLQLAPGTRVAPVRLQARNRVDEPWRELPSSVFYRLERGADISTSPPVALSTSARYLRVLPDARAAALDASQTKLVVQASLASLVFATQGQAPFMLLAGSANAASSALAVATLVPALDDERGRFGRATLGEWSEVAAAARAEASQKKLAAMRPWLLWAVLLAGVAGLGFMVWRLARGAAPQT
jgi:virulence-associated protein VagC